MYVEVCCPWDYNNIAGIQKSNKFYHVQFSVFQKMSSFGSVQKDMKKYVVQTAAASGAVKNPFISDKDDSFCCQKVFQLIELIIFESSTNIPQMSLDFERTLNLIMNRFWFSESILNKIFILRNYYQQY